MARPLLIALLTVTAVAWPVAALGPLSESPPVEPVTLDPSISLTAASCRIAHVDTEPENQPNISVQTDPDGCLRELVNKVWPLTEWELIGDEPAPASESEPSASDADGSASQESQSPA